MSKMISIKCCIGILLVLLCQKGLTFMQRPHFEYRLSYARMDSRSSFQNSSTASAVTGVGVSVSAIDGVSPGSATVRFDPNIQNYATSGNVARSSYRNSGSEVPLTVSSSIGSHSYRENRPSNDKSERSDRDRERTTGNGPRSGKDRPSSSSAPYRGRGSSRSSSGGGGPDVIFSSGFDSHRNSQRGKESFNAGDNNNRDSRDGNSNNQKAFTKPWKSRRPFDPSLGGIETTQDYPSSSYRTVVYDHLATSSLEGIEALPHIKFSKGRTYLTKWWLAAKKWNLLCDELKEIDEVFMAKSAVNPDKTSTQNQKTETQHSSRYPSAYNVSDQRIQQESDRISVVLSQIMVGDSSPVAASRTSTSRSMRATEKESTTSNSLESSSVVDLADGIILSEISDKDSEISEESPAENKINELIAKTIENVLSSETTRSTSGGWQSPADATLQPDGVGEAFNEVAVSDQSWVGDSPEGPLDRSLGSGTGDRDTDRVSDREDEREGDSFSTKRAKRGELDNWGTGKSDESDDNYRGSQAYDRQSSWGETRTYSENDMSVPIEELYSVCDKHKARVICIGDVHGCVDELKDLLRAVKYRPGDLVLLLGDLVAKGPSSAEVVRLAMDIGALSVRGNHDHEVVRQGLKYRQRGSESYDRDRENRDRENREKERERDREREKENLSEREKAGSAASAASNSSKAKSTVSGNGTGVGSGGAVTGSGSGSGSETNGAKTISNRVQQHLEIGMQLSVKELAWLAELPFYVRSVDLGCVFVHAGFKAGKKLSDQDPWVMMTVRSLLPDGRMSPRCFNRHPWANKWKGPLTAYFGHDAARGLQVYDCAVGLDTGCVYGGHLSAVLLPEKKFVQVPARKAYQPYGKSRSHKMYAWSNDNETETEPTQSELELYEFSSSKLNTTMSAKFKNQSPMIDLNGYAPKAENLYRDSTDSEMAPMLIEGQSTAGQVVKKKAVTSVTAVGVEASEPLGHISSNSRSGDITALSSAPSAAPPATPVYTSLFSDSPLTKEIEAALAVPSPTDELTDILDSFAYLEDYFTSDPNVSASDPTSIGDRLFESTSVLSGPRILQKRDELDRTPPPAPAPIKPCNHTNDYVETVAAFEATFVWPEFAPFIPAVSVSAEAGVGVGAANVAAEIKVPVSVQGPVSTATAVPSGSLEDFQAKTIALYAQQEEERKQTHKRVIETDLDDEDFILKLQQSMDIIDKPPPKKSSALIDAKYSPLGAMSYREASDTLLAEFLEAAEVGDEKMTLIVQRGLHEVLLLEFGNEATVLESLKILMSREDYLRLDVGRALRALSYDLAKMEQIKEGSCDAYGKAMRFAGKMSENKLIDLIRLHGSELDLPEFNMKRKPSKEEYVAIIFKILVQKFNNDVDGVSRYLELETMPPLNKGFGARGTGFGPSSKKSPPKM